MSIDGNGALTLAACLCAVALGVGAQEFKPHPRADITPAQWRDYFDEVKSRHLATERRFPSEHLVVYRDEKSGMNWAFTTPGHPAHPAWVTRQPVRAAEGVSIQQIGYFAGNEPEFAKLFKAYLAMNDRIREDFKKDQPAPALAQSQIESRRIGDDAYELTLRKDSVAEVGVAQQELLPVATQLCKEKSVRFGRYEFSLHEHVAGPTPTAPQFLLKQQVSCGTPFDDQRSVVPANKTDWKPSETDQASIERLTYQYFRSKDFGSYRDAYLLFSPGVIAWESWRDSISQFNQAAGAVKSRRIKKITWYIDPPTGGPGVYAAVDYDSAFENLYLQCGYVVWRRQPNGAFLLVREEQNSIDKANAEKLTNEQIQSIRAKYKCA
jgi:hypothetical protein